MNVDGPKSANGVSARGSGSEGTTTQFSGPDVSAIGKVGIILDAAGKIGGTELHGTIDLGTINYDFSLKASYITQAFGAALIMRGQVYGFGIERASYNGGLSFEGWQRYGTLRGIQISNDAVTWGPSFAAGLGGTVNLNLLNLISPAY